MKRKTSDSLITIYIFILLIYITISNFFITYNLYKTLNLSNVLFYFGIVGLILYVFNKVINKIKFDIYDFLILCLILAGIISTIYAIKPEIALNGFNSRYEGLLQIFTYYILFLNCKNIDNKLCKRLLIWLIIFLGAIQAIYAIIQFSNTKYLFGYRIIRKRFYSTGFERNPNFLATIMIVSLTLSLSIYFIKNNRLISLLSFVCSEILFLGLLCSGSMSVVVSLFFIFILLIILFFVLKLKLWPTLVKVLLISLAFFTCYRYFNINDKGYYLSQIEKSTSEIGETITGNAKPIYGSGRIYIWKRTLEIVPDNLWNGVGIDNFYLAFDDSNILVDPYSGSRVDKAHNEYLQKLVTEGIFSIILYIGLLGILCIRSMIQIFKERKKENVLLISLFLSFIAYCIQAFFNISVISVAPIFYIIMGLLCSFSSGGKNEKVKN